MKCGDDETAEKAERGCSPRRRFNLRLNGGASLRIYLENDGISGAIERGTSDSFGSRVDRHQLRVKSTRP
jgi:hypothetical protein